MKACHLVCGPPASGKTHYARELAATIGGFVVDSDEVAERLVRAGLQLAGLDPDDRDSPAYKAAYREVVYETMYDLARRNLPVVPVVMVGPFTSECSDSGWLDALAGHLGSRPKGHFVWCDPEERRRRVIARGEPRDRPKLASWDEYLLSCREDPPAWPHRFVNTSPGS